MTNDIMSQLGYVRIDAVEARRLRQRRWLARAATLAMVVGVAAFGVHLHSMSERARTTGPQPLPSAISTDLTNVRDGLRDAGRVMFPDIDRQPAGTTVNHPQSTPSPADPCQSRVPWSGLL